MKNFLTKNKKWVLVVSAVLVAVLLFTWLGSRSSQGSVHVQTVTVGRSDVHTTIVGSGTLAFDSTSGIHLPSALEIQEVLVQNGEYVQKGDTLAIANYASLLDSIDEVRSEMSSLDREINYASDSTKTEYVTSYVSGRIKAVYAVEGDKAAEVMWQDGALAILSTSGKMAVDFPLTENISIGDGVKVLLSDGEEAEGEIINKTGELCTAVISDNGPKLGEKVTVQGEDGHTLGQGLLYIHQPLPILGSGGVVSSVNITENQYVYAGNTVFVLKEVPASAEYRQLIQERTDLADALSIMVLAAGNEGMLASPFDGTVQNVSLSNAGEQASDSTEGLSYDMLTSLASVGFIGTQVFPEESSVPAEAAISDLSMLLLTAPVAGAAAVTHMAGVTEYTADIVWTPGDTTFQNGTVYTAIYTLAAKGGYYFEAGFAPSVSGAVVPLESVSLSEDGKTLTFSAVYPATVSLPTIQVPTYEMPDLSGLLQQATSGLGGGYSIPTVEAESELLMNAFQIGTFEDSMVVSISIDELDILNIAKGQEARVIFDALEGSFEGTIVRIASASELTEGSAKYMVDISIEQTPGMRAGMSATATIAAGVAENALVIPVAALQEQDGHIFVYTSYDAKADVFAGEVEVETGLSDGTTVEVVSGLKEGDTVYYLEVLSSSMYEMMFGGGSDEEE